LPRIQEDLGFEGFKVVVIRQDGEWLWQGVEIHVPLVEVDYNCKKFFITNAVITFSR